jgi:hypothetical protein
MIRSSPSTDLVEILKQSAPEEAKELEPQPKEWAMMVLKLPEGLGLTVADIDVFEGTDWKEQRAATGQGIRSILVCLLDVRGFWRRRRVVLPNLSS